MDIKFEDNTCEGDYINVSSTLLEESMLFAIKEGSNKSYASINREDSIKMATKILKFWNNNPK